MEKTTYPANSSNGTANNAIERGVEMPQEEGLFLEATLFGVACATEDMREGTKAFLEKRPAQFKGK